MSGSERHSETNFWSGVLTIFGSQLAVKLLGLIYRLGITNISHTFLTNSKYSKDTFLNRLH